MKGPSKRITEGIDRLYETFTEPLTLKEIADACGCSHTAILNIEKAALAKLADKFKERGIVRNNFAGKVAKYGTKITRPGDITDHTPKPFDDEKYYEQVDFRYSKPFVGYRRMIESILKKLTHDSKMCDCELRDRQWDGFGKCLRCGKSYPPTIRDIHVRLGVEANPRWTLDAMEMSKYVLTLWGIPNRYIWYDGPATVERVQWNGMVINPPKKNPDLGLEGRILA